MRGHHIDEGRSRADGRRATTRPRPSSETESVETQVLVANPTATQFDVASGVWVVAGQVAPSVREAIEDGADFETVRQRLAATAGEYSLVHLDLDGVVHAHRGITSRHEVFFCRGSDGTPIVTDQFRNALAQLDAAERTVTPEIVADHLLYRTTPVGSYLAEVGRLGFGDSLRWDPARGEPETWLAETLAPQDRIDLETAAQRLDGVLESVIGDLDDHGLMLSGGVDSTLLGTYEPAGARMASAAYDSPEFALDVDYAERAGRLLDADHHLVVESEARFPEHLERAIDAAGMPLQLLQTPLQGLVFEHGGTEAYVSGLLADYLFGLDAATARLVWLTRPLRYLPPVTGKLRTHREIAAQLGRPASHPQGFAANCGQYLPQEQVTEIIGRDRVDERQAVRAASVGERVPLGAPTADLASHLEWGHWTYYLTANLASPIRQVAQGYGVTLHLPFADRRVVDLSLALPYPERYLDGFEDKPLTKTLLAHRLPEYRTDQPKSNGNLPENRFFRDGPMADVFDRYPIPAFVPDRVASRLPDRAPALAWVVSSYAVWRDRVLENDDVAVVPGTRRIGL